MLNCTEIITRSIFLFFNIYKNAIEAINNKGIIKTTVTPDIGKTTITIEDNGGGISPVVLNNLGTPFVTTKENGSGLGILICKNIVHEHKGKIDLKTQIMAVLLLLNCLIIFSVNKIKAVTHLVQQPLFL